MNNEMSSEVREKYIKAGMIAARVREASREIVKPGVKILDIAESIEQMIYEEKGEPAFPVNISLNDAAAHDTADFSDARIISENDIVKIDLGVHIDGYVGDTAYTVAWNSDYDQLIEASRKALDAAIALCKPGTNIKEIGAAIERTIRTHGFQPIRNLTGHGLEQYNLHAEPQIPNYPAGNFILQKGQVIAIEPFATTLAGSGMIKESEPTLIYMVIRESPTRNMDARSIMRYARTRDGLPFSVRWLPVSGFKLKLALRELMQNGALYEYPVLKEQLGAPISQAEHTIIVDDEPVVTTKL